MRAGRSPLAVIFLTVFIDLIGFGIVIPVLPLYAEHFGATPLQIGCLLAIYSVMQALCAPLLGRISDRVGRRPVLFVSLLGSAAGFALMGAAWSLPILFLARAIDGITGGNISTAQAYIADVTKPEERAKGMGLIGAAFGLGFIFGPAIGGVLSHVSLAAPFYFAAGLALVNALGALIMLPESLPKERRGTHHAIEGGVLELVRHRPSPALARVMLTYFLATIAFSLLTATYPLFTWRKFGFSAAQNGYIFAGLGLVAAAIQGGAIGMLVKRFAERRLVVAGAMCLGLSLLALPFSATTGWLVIITAGVALGHGLLAAPLNGLASKEAGGGSQGQVLGLMQSAASVGRIFGPVLGGALLQYDVATTAQRFGQTPYWAGALVMLAAAIVATKL